MSAEGLVDRLLAAGAMLLAVRPLTQSLIGTTGRLSWRRALACLAGGGAALAACVGLLVVRALLLRQPELLLPTWMGGTLAFVAGMLGMATLLAQRGVSEDAAIRRATLAVGMTVYVASPLVALVGLGLTRLLRVWLFPVSDGHRGWRLVEGLAMLALVLAPRDPELGGLRQLVALPGIS